MRLNGQKISNFGGKGRFSTGAAVKTSKTKNYACNHKTQLLSEITFTVSLKIKPDNQICANVSTLPPPSFIKIVSDQNF